MANKFVVQLEVDQSGVIQNVDTVEKKFNEIADSTNSVKKELRELQKQLSNLDQGSDEFQKLAKRAGELKDRLNDAAEAARNNAGNSFEVLGNNARGLKDSIINLDFEGVASSLRGIAGAAQGVKFGDLLTGIKNVGSSFAALGKALLTNPLFLLIAGVGLLIANFDKITDALDGVTAAQVEAAEAAQKASDAAKEQYDFITSTENSLRLQGKSEAQIRDLKKQQLELAIAAQESAIEQQKVILQTQIEAAERNRKILKGIIDFVALPFYALATQIDVIGKAIGQDFGLANLVSEGTNAIAKTLFDPEEVKTEGEATIKEAEKQLAQLKNTRDGLILQERKENADRAKQREADLLAERQALSKQLEEIFKLRQAIQAEIEKDLPKGDSRLSKLKSETDEEFKLLQQQEDLKLQLLADGQEKEIALVDQKYIKLREQAEGNAELTKQLAEKNAAEVADIEKKYADQRAENERKVQQSKLNLTGDVLGALGALNDSFGAKSEAAAKRQFQINKGIAIAQTLISTYQSAQAAYASQLAIPSPDAPIRAGIAAGAAVIAGLAQVNKIRQQQFNAGGGGAGGVSTAPNVGGSAPGGGAPQFSPVNTDFLGNRPEQPVTPAYVLASNVVNATEARQRIDQQARLG